MMIKPCVLTLSNRCREGVGHPLEGARFPGAGAGGGSFPVGHPMAAAGAHLMGLNNPAALLSRSGNI